MGTANKIKGFAAQLRKLTIEAEDMTAAEAIKMIIKETDFFSDYPSDSEEREDRMENVYELVNIAVVSEKNKHGISAIEDFLTESALLSGIDSLDEKEDSVVLMTLHSAKGLEFPNVYIAGMEEETFPSYRSIQSADPSALEEERRLCYAGITGAKKVLTLTSAAERMLYGNIYHKEVSRFISEIPQDLIDHMVPKW